MHASGAVVIAVAVAAATVAATAMGFYYGRKVGALTVFGVEQLLVVQRLILMERGISNKAQLTLREMISRLRLCACMSIRRSISVVMRGW